MKSARWMLLLAGLAVVAGLLRLRFDVEVMNLLPNDEPVVMGLRLYQENFANARELIVTVSSDEAETSENLARALAQQLRGETNLVASVLWQPPWLEHPGQAAELIAHLWLNQPPAVVNELARRLAPTNLVNVLAGTRSELATSMSPADIARLSYDPYGLTKLPESVASSAPAFTQGQEFFASADGKFRIIFIQSKGELISYRDCAQWLEKIKGQVATAASGSGSGDKVQIGYTGRPVFVAEIAGGMERDMVESVLFTAIIIGILFWLSHRRWAPMLWLLVLLGLILLGTLALGGLIFGTINVVSLGFAAILLGLAVDYGVVHYQEALASPNAIIPEIRRAIGPSIFWAAVTTISAFLVLNFGGLPGLAQLGSLVAVGVALSAVVMLYAFLPPLFRDRLKKREEQLAAGVRVEPAHEANSAKPISPLKLKLAFGGTLLVFGAAVAVLVSGLPRMDRTANALRPRNSLAYAALDKIKSLLTQNREPLWLITSAKNEAEIARRLDAATVTLTAAVSNHAIESFTLPTALWPRPEFQAANCGALRELIAQRATMEAVLLANGFTSNSFALTEDLLGTWQTAVNSKNVFWPTNEMSQWILGKLAARPPGGVMAVGLIYPATNAPVTTASISGWASELAREGFLVSGWELLGSAVLQRVEGNLWRVVLPMVGLVLLSLWLAFRRAGEILLSLAVLCLSGVCLLAVMRVLGWSWNLLNLMALPLMLGTGVDYSIFMQLALRRHAGDLAAAYRSVGRALLLCGGTAVAGFGSLSLSSNAGMASLGAVCAVGVGFNMLISIYLLPVWWRKFCGEKLVMTPGSAVAQGPSALYGAFLWRAGLAVVNGLPGAVVAMLGRGISLAYWSLNGRRREIVTANLLPVMGGDKAAARQATTQLCRNFVQKLIDLWRYEAGQEVDQLFIELTGWEHFQAAQASGRGILLITPHLGNWEFGAPLLAKGEVKLVVLTQAEPGEGLTEMRQASRARWGIETIVVGQDGFAFVEIIKRLQSGAAVALLVDRPPARGGVEVQLFGQPFQASIAAAELARASGCAVLPVVLPRTKAGYAAQMLPELAYDRAALGKRENRIQFTQEIMRAFEPAIRQHADQWYHFVPVWPRSR